MLKELIAVFRSKEPLQESGELFQQMLRLSLEVVRKGGAILFSGEAPAPDLRKNLQKSDVEVNRLERRIRRQVVVHLTTTSSGTSIPYCLLLMSLVKDVERIGDYGKDLATVLNMTEDPLPEDELVSDLRRIGSEVEAELEAACEVVQDADRDRAIELIRSGRHQVDRCEALVTRISRSQYPAGTAVALTLAARSYMRISGHVLNLLSSVVMPLDRLDYYDEKDIARAEKSL
jgi:phosphate uptake regulator